MGFSNAWIAIRNKTLDNITSELNLKQTGIFEDYPGSSINITRLPSDWILLFTEIDHAATKQKNLTTLSLGCKLIICFVEEHTMYSSAELWESGKKIWSIEHDAHTSITDITTFGVLPENYENIYKEYAQKQEDAGGNKADVDMFFEIPLQVANEIVGFKHDETELEEESFEVLEPIQTNVQNTVKVEPKPFIEKKNTSKIKPWWQFW